MLVGHSFHQRFPQTHIDGGALRHALSMSPESEELDTPESEGGADDSLEEAARKERESMREHLRAELKRDPTDEELNDWLRRHTEGY
jgi:hypothetical protein